MFLQAAELSPGEIKAYRKWAFTVTLCDPDNDPFFSVDTAASWMTSSGYQLHVLHEDLVASTPRLAPEDASTKQLKAFRNYILGEEYQTHPFFSLENPEKWIGPDAFQAYIDTHAEPRNLRNEFSPHSSRAPSRASSSISMAPSRASSRVSFVPSSRASSPVSYSTSDIPSFADFSRSDSPISNHESDLPSRPSSSMSVIEIYDSDSENGKSLGDPAIPAQSGNSITRIQPKVENDPLIIPPAHISSNSLAPNITRKKGKVAPAQISVTRQLKVDEIIRFTSVPPTFDVPRNSAAILLDLSGLSNLLMKGGKIIPVDRFVRAENQESWDGSSGHAKGDVIVYGFFPDLKEGVLCRRVDLTCNGVDVCEFLDPALFAGLERFEADEAAMRELWIHELDQNEAEAASPWDIIARIKNSKCKIQCDGTPVLVVLQNPSTYGKNYFVGCSQWTRSAEMGDHLYWAMPPNVDEDVLRFVMENGGRLPTAPTTMNPNCILTVHPRIGLTHCPFSHIIDGEIRPAKLQRRRCGSKMIIHVPVEQSPTTLHKAIVILRNPHNHPMHPRAKPSANDKFKLSTAVEAVGLNGLTVQKLLDAPSTSSIYDGKRVAESSPAFTNTRKVRQLIIEKKKAEHPNGLGWEGVLYHLNREMKLPKSERYIHTAMSKNGFRLVVTMHPQIVMLIHKILSLIIDFTFKRVEGKMDEWEVVGFVDGIEKRYTLASLYCDTKNKEAFTQLFIEFFDTVFAGIKSLQEEMKLDRHRTDLQEQVVAMRGEVDAEKAIRREWAVRRLELDKEIERLRKGGLAGVRLKGRRPTERPSGEEAPSADISPTSTDCGAVASVPTANLTQQFGVPAIDETSTMVHNSQPAVDPNPSLSTWDQESFDEFLASFAYSGPVPLNATYGGSYGPLSGNFDQSDSAAFHTQPDDTDELQYFGLTTDYSTGLANVQEWPEFINGGPNLNIDRSASDAFQAQSNMNGLEYFGPHTEYTTSVAADGQTLPQLHDGDQSPPALDNVYRP
ncbi:hypothetical protein B0H12DRAFT_1245429 [Mycena haematopus]|nr:hypothetical protein B0H12DRAFT_1245429 [Mycena haematopus]